MRTLPSTTVGDWIFFPDSDDPGLRWVLRARPVGAGTLSLVRWHAVDGPADGRLVLEVRVGPAPAELATLRAATGASDLRPLPVTGGRVELAVEGERVVADAIAVDDRVVVALDLPSPVADRVEALATGSGVLPVRATWETTVWVQLPSGRLEVAANEGLLDLLDGERPPNLAAAVSIAVSGSVLAPEALLDWAWAELRRRHLAGEPLSFAVAAGALLALPVALSTTLDTLGPVRVQHVDLAAETGLRQRTFEVRVAGDPATAGWGAVEARLTVDGVVRVGTPAPTVSWSFPFDRAATWSWRPVPRAGAPGPWSAEQPASGVGWVLVPSTVPQEVTVSAAGLDLAHRWERIDVRIEGDPVGTLTLDAARPNARWTGRDRRGGVATYTAFGGAVRQAEATSLGETWVLPDPEPDLVEVLVVRSGGGWTGVTAWVDIEHADGEAWRRQTAVLDVAGARVNVPAGAAWQWREHLRHDDGSYTRGEWRTGHGTVAVVSLAAPVGVRMQVLPLWFDATLSRIELVLRPTGGPETRCVISDARALELTLVGALPVAWEATWVHADGTSASAAGTADRNVLVVPRG